MIGPMAPTTQQPGTQDSRFHHLLDQQVRSEFTAAQQYIAVAVWFDKHDLPQLARYFYRQAVEERNHAMMIIQYLLDNDIPFEVPDVDKVRNEFTEPSELVALALEQEREVTREIHALAAAARAEDDYAGEAFLQWFLAEQVEEESSLARLLTVVQRADGNLFEVETWLARETPSQEAGAAPIPAPKAAGEAL
jgi:ferritin